MVPDTNTEGERTMSEAEKLKIPTPLCRRVLDMIHELEAGQRQFAMQNYLELRAAGTS